MENFLLSRWLCKWSLRAGAISIGAFFTMSSLSYFLYYVVHAASAPLEVELSHFHITAGLLLFCMCSSLLYGAIKESRLFLIPFILFGGSSINILAFAIVTFSLENPLALIIALPLMPYAYCWLIVYSYYEELNPNRSQYPSNTVISYANAPMDQTEPVKYPEVV